MDEQAQGPGLREFREDLRKLLNQRSIDNYTNTPDFVLADMVADVLNAFAQASVWHRKYYRCVRRSTPIDTNEQNKPADLGPGTRQQNPTHASMLKYFEYDHLPEKLQAVSKVFHIAACQIAGMGDLDGREVQVALRKLLEAKDAAVRAALPANHGGPR